MTVEEHGTVTEYREGDWWYETNVDPVVARSTGPQGTRFIRIMVLPPEFEGHRSVHFIDPEDGQRHRRVSAAGGARWISYVDKVIAL